MDCRTAREILMFDAPGSTGEPLPVEVADHLTRCPECAMLRGDLARLDESWRAIPLPPGVETAREDFLRRFRETAGPRKLARRRRTLPRWAIAATVLLAIGVGAGLFMRPRPVAASSDVVDRLVDWNLSLAHAPSAVERERIYASHASLFADEVEKASLPDDDRDLVRSLLEEAPGLVREPDPLVEADRFDELADKLLARMNRAARGGDTPRFDHSAALYRRVAELGIESKLEVLESSVSLDFDKQRRLERLVLRDEGRMNKLVELLERVPDSSRKQIKRALGIKRRPKKGPAGNPATEDARKTRVRKGDEPAIPSGGEIPR
jgi:hypothetical protein